MMTDNEKYILRAEIINLKTEREWAEFQRVDAEEAVLKIERQIREKEDKLDE